jgi:uncharacterized protein (TIGR03066 family)
MQLRQSKPGGVAVTKSSFWLPRWALITLCLLLAGGTTWAAFEFVILSKLPRELVGKWVVAGGKQDGATFDFSRSGSMVARLNHNGQEATINASVAVQGDTLLVTTRHPQTGAEDTRRLKIVELTDRRLILQDEHGELWKMEHAE